MAETPTTIVDDRKWYTITKPILSRETNQRETNTLMTFIMPVNELIPETVTFGSLKTVLELTLSDQDSIVGDADTRLVVDFQLYCQTRKLVLRKIQVDCSDILTSFKTIASSNRTSSVLRDYKSVQLSGLKEFLPDYDCVWQFKVGVSNPLVSVALNGLQSLYFTKNLETHPFAEEGEPMVINAEIVEPRILTPVHAEASSEAYPWTATNAWFTDGKYWSSAEEDSSWITYDIGYNVRVYSILAKCPLDEGGSNIKIQGSVDNQTWEDIHTFDSSKWSKSSDAQSYLSNIVPVSPPFRFLKLVCDNVDKPCCKYDFIQYKGE